MLFVDDETTAVYRVKRHPIKVICSVGTAGEWFPMNKGLPEVVRICMMAAMNVMGN